MADKVITSSNRPTMGTSAYMLDGPSNADFMAGMQVARGGPTSLAPDSVTGHRTPIQENLGPALRILPSMKIPQDQPPTQRNTRLVPSVMGTRAFWKG